VLLQLCNSNNNKSYKNITHKVNDKLQKELKVIIELKFVSFFNQLWYWQLCEKTKGILTLLEALLHILLVFIFVMINFQISLIFVV
jgi:hypothetical protein